MTLQAQLRGENSKTEVWCSLARLRALDKEIYREALARVPSAERGEAEAAVRSLVRTMVPRDAQQRTRETLRIRAIQALLKSAAVLPTMACQVRADMLSLEPLRVVSRRLPTPSLEPISTFLCAGRCLRTLFTALYHVKQHGYNPGGQPIFAKAPCGDELVQRHAEIYSLALKVHHNVLEVLEGALIEYVRLVEQIPLQARALAAERAWALVASMTLGRFLQIDAG